MRITLFVLIVGTSLPCLPAYSIEPETARVETLGAPRQNWVLIKGFERATIYDVETGKMQGGMAVAMHSPAVQVAKSGRELYAASSYWSREIRGDRTDVLEIFDYENLRPVAEIGIPNKIVSISYPGYTGLTGNGRFVTVSNLTPAQSISVVNVEERQFVGEISTAGCSMTEPVGDDGFLMICGDGSLQLLRLNDDGSEAGRYRSKKFFDLDDDPVFEWFVRGTDGWLLISHKGKAYNVSVDESRIRIGKSWSLVTEDEAKAKWRPGGRQLVTAHAESGLMYVLMHTSEDGKEYTHNKPGSEVWVFDTARQKRVAKLTLENPAIGLHVTRGSQPRLLIKEADAPKLHVYDAVLLSHLRTIEQPAVDGSYMQDMQPWSTP